MKICFLTKKEKFGVEQAINFTKSMVKDVDIYSGDITSPFPENATKIKYDILISYISPWIVPAEILGNTKKWNINFHPGPPEYPGIGCFNFAIFDSANQFGSTAHIMNSKVDSGKIIGVKRFSIRKNETVDTLSIKTYKAQLCLFKDTLKYIITNDCLPNSEQVWKRKPYKRRELEELATIKVGMSKKEIEKRIRATYYAGKPAPFIEISGHRFEYNPER